MLGMGLSLGQVAMRRSGVSGNPPGGTVSKLGRIGTNLANNGLQYYSSSLPLLNRMKMASGGGSTVWNKVGGGAAIPLNANRYPTGLAGGSALTNIGSATPTGTDTLRTNRVDAVFNHTPLTDVTVGGVRTITYNYTATLDGGAYRYPLEITSLPTPFGTNDYIEVIKSFEVALYDSGERFTAAFIAACQDWAIVRSMDWTNTNKALDYSMTSTSLNNASYFDAAPIEILVALANRAGVDLHFCCPVKATDSQITAFATYLRDQLVGKLTWEWGNETWNFDFPNWAYITAQGTAQFGAGDHAFKWAGYRAAQAAALVSTVFAANRSKVFIALGVKSSDPAIFDDQYTSGIVSAGFADAGAVFDTFLITNYISGGVQISSDWSSGDRTADRATILSWARATNDSGLSAFFNVMRGTATPGTLTHQYDNLATYTAIGTSDWTTRALALGMYVSFYEGGLHHSHVTDGYTSPELVEVIDFFNRANADARMGTLYTDLYAAARAASPLYIDHFYDFGPITIYGSWGAADNILNSNTPRRTALKSFNQSPPAAPALAVSHATSGSPVVGGSSATTFRASGGVPPYTFTLLDSPPPGRAFAQRRKTRVATMSGTYTTVGSTTYHVRVTDFAGTVTDATVTVDVAAAPTGYDVLHVEVLSSNNAFSAVPPLQFYLTADQIRPLTSVGALISTAGATFETNFVSETYELSSLFDDHAGSGGYYVVCGNPGLTPPYVINVIMPSGDKINPSSVTISNRPNDGNYGFATFRIYGRTTAQHAANSGGTLLVDGTGATSARSYPALPAGINFPVGPNPQ